MPYSPEDRERIIWAVFLLMEKEGKSLRSSCQQEGISETTVLRWIDEDETGELSKQYMRARDGLLSLHAHEMLTIVDGCDDPAKARVQIDARKWLYARLMPKRFGDKVQTELSGSVTLSHEDRLKELG
jgi:transposase